MKISIKEIKIEDDGTEILYIGNVGFVIKSETFSGPLKRCLEKGKEEKGKEQEIDVEALVPILAQIVSQFMSAQQQAQAGKEAAPQDQAKEPAVGTTKVPVE
jgi:hypothetical protein